MENCYYLYNRDGNNLWLEPSNTNKGWYKLVSESKIMSHCQVTFGKNGDVVAIDPPGGPFISLGKNQDKDGKPFVVDKINNELELKIRE